jgi:hypothetical protein|tara:strand:+ start:301 stop:696 length:396 start_codon:yes stop_codon:yes gene_type:complete
MSGERLTINADGLVTNIETDDDYIVEAGYNYSQPQYIHNPSEDIGNHNIFSMSHDIDGKMRITGEDADIEINGISLKQTLHNLQERMAILEPNPALEAEFKELRELRQKYIQLERNLLEKKEMWDTLNRDD